MSAAWLRRLAKPVVLAAGIGTAVLAWRGRPMPARAASVDRGSVSAETVGTGTIEGDDVVSIAFTASGRIASLEVDEGAHVVAGQFLGTLDTSDANRQLAVARASEGLAATSIAKAKTDVARARVTRDAASKELERTLALRASDAASGVQVDDDKERFDRAEAELSGALVAVTQAGATTVVARETSSLQSRRLDDGRLTSPVDGVVVKRAHAVGDVVGNGVTVFTVISTKKIRARAWIDETALAALREGGEARVVLRSQPDRPLRGRVERVGLEADRQTHEVLVDVELLERPPRLAFGQRVDVFLTIDARADVTRAPLGFCDVGAGSCLVEREGRVSRASVKFGLVGAEFAEIGAGLAPGDVLLAPLPDGAPLSLGRRVKRSTP
jgi:RND family efflux transporter MFP subunit